MSCAKTAPQRPSQRSSEAPEADSTLLAMMEVNERLVMEADKQVLQWVQKQTAHYNQMDCGAWRIERDSETSQRAQTATATPQPKEQWLIHYQVMHLDSALAEDTEGSFTIARGELPTAIDETVQHMIANETATIIAPWYSAFGLKGTEHVRAYENVLIHITLKEKI